MEAQTVRLNPDNMAVIKCPHCGTARTVNAAKLNNPRGPLKARCKRGAAFHVLFEVRKAYRKGTRLHGNYVKQSSDKEQGRIIVRNISLSGIGFTRLTKHNLKQGDKVKLRFTLDDKRRSEIEKNGVVRVVDDRSVGCQFTAPSSKMRPWTSISCHSHASLQQNSCILMISLRGRFGLTTDN